MVSAEPSPEALRTMMSATSGLACMAVSEADLRKVKMPGSLENCFAMGALFPEDRARKGFGNTSSERAFKQRLVPFTTHKNGVLGRPRVAECASDLARMLGGDQCSLFCTFGSDSRGPAIARLNEMVKAYSLKVLSIVELVRYRLLHEEHVRSRGSTPVMSKHGKFQFACIESDVFEQCGVLIKGDRSSFHSHPPMVRIENIPRAGSACTCLLRCAGASFTDSSELMHRDGCGIIIFMPYMGELSPGRVVQEFTLEHFRDDPFSTLGDSIFRSVVSAGVCAQIIRHLGAVSIRAISNRPHRLKDLESFGIKIVEEVSIKQAQSELEVRRPVREPLILM